MRQRHQEETLRATEHAERTHSDLSREAAVADLGKDGSPRSALAISFYCALVARDFKERVILAINDDGDSDLIHNRCA
jgi:ADP-ribosyl-[dinitrogen reductase] hydrolase